MKRILMLGAIVLLAILPYAEMAVANGTLGALGKGAHGSAEVARGFICGLGPGISTFDSHATLSASGNETLHCHGEHPYELDKPMKMSGFVCGLEFGGTTTNSRIVYTPSGRANLRCQS